MKQEIEILFFLFFWEVEAEFTVPLVSITLNTRTVLGIFSEHSLGWGFSEPFPLSEIYYSGTSPQAGW